MAGALGNALRQDLAPALRAAMRAALEAARAGASPLLAEHIDWALAQDLSPRPPA